MILQKSFFHLRNIAKLQNMLTVSDAEKIVHAFVTSRLDYCNALLGGCPASSINKLQIVQNAAAIVLNRSRKYDHQIKSNQIKSLLLSHHHSTSALVSEILMSVLQTVQKNNRQFTYGQTVQKNNKQFTYGQTVQKNNKQFTYGQTVQKNNKQFTYGQTVQKNNKQFTYGQTVQKNCKTVQKNILLQFYNLCTGYLLISVSVTKYYYLPIRP